MSATPLTGLAPYATGAYREALEHLFVRTGGGSRYGLERTRALLALLGDPQRAMPVFHVAGTNGKGSTVATIATLLRARGLRVGRYTSPHLIDFRERIAVDGRPIGEADVVEFVRRHASKAEATGATFFEFTTAMAFDHFARAGVDVAVIEAGLGGRYDATNVVSPIVAAVTEIGFDHTDLLGTTLESIEHHKAGVFKRGSAAVIGARDAIVCARLARLAHEAGAEPVRVVADEVRVGGVDVAAQGTSFDLDAPFGRARLSTPLLGRFQAWNAATALTVLDAAGPSWTIPMDQVAVALRGVRLPGRFQRVGHWIFDVAHNPDGARVLAETLRGLDVPRPITALVAVLADKDWAGILAALAPSVDHLVLTTAPTATGSRVWDPSAAHAFATSKEWSAELVRDFDVALVRAREGAATTLVTGSFHTVGDAMARLQVDPLAE